MIFVSAFYDCFIVPFMDVVLWPEKNCATTKWILKIDNVFTCGISAA